MTWECKNFDQLTTFELYDILQLRNEVFVVEQHCVYQDMDNKDLQCFHLMGWRQNKLVAYARILPPDLVYTEASIGRVVTSPLARRAGLGKELMERSLKEVTRLFGSISVKIGAQIYLKKFYTGLGFQQVGDPYDEDGIEHIVMIRL